MPLTIEWVDKLHRPDDMNLPLYVDEVC